METALIKYFAFMIGSVLAVGLTMLWLKANKRKRKEKEKRDEALEIQKQLHRQALEEKAKLEHEKIMNKN